jgi:hypothetical protein
VLQSYNYIYIYIYNIARKKINSIKTKRFADFGWVVYNGAQTKGMIIEREFA